MLLFNCHAMPVAILQALGLLQFWLALEDKDRHGFVGREPVSLLISDPGALGIVDEARASTKDDPGSAWGLSIFVDVELDTRPSVRTMFLARVWPKEYETKHRNGTSNGTLKLYS